MQVLTFTLGEEVFAINVELVDSIENLPQYTMVPKARDILIGLISIRGNVVPVINSGILLNKIIDKHKFRKLIVTTVKKSKLALAVEDIEDVVEIPDGQVEELSKDESISVMRYNSELITMINSKTLAKI